MRKARVLLTLITFKICQCVAATSRHQFVTARGLALLHASRLG
jgi:hypothetical protein